MGGNMKIIDEKGRLFGKVNIIDFLVIIFLICLTPMLYFGYKLYKKSGKVPAGSISIEMNCKFIKIKPEILKLISVGDKEIDKKGNQIGEITWIGESRSFKHQFDMGPMEDKYQIEDPTLKQLFVKLKLITEMREDELYYNGNHISIDSPFRFETSKYSLKVVPAIEKIHIWKELKVKLSGVSPGISKMINEGYIEKDRQGRIIGKLKTVLSTSPTQMSVIKLEDNKFVFINDPYRSDIVVILDVLCNAEDDGTLSFNNYPVKMGSQITFASDSYMVSGAIIGIENK
jgi:hypothetical protein